jgi:hypothetical protein
MYTWIRNLDTKTEGRGNSESSSDEVPQTTCGCSRRNNLRIELQRMEDT